MRLLHLLMHDDLDRLDFAPGEGPPASLLRYVRSIRDLSLGREPSRAADAPPALPRAVAVGMKPKKAHEVARFADYVQRLADEVARSGGGDLSHLVDLGSGQNYLGRALASAPHRRRVVAVEGREANVAAARELDLLSGLAAAPQVRRNKKLWHQVRQAMGPGKPGDAEALAAAVRQVAGAEAFEFRPDHRFGAESGREPGEAEGRVQYVAGRLDSGDLGAVLAGVGGGARVLAMSIHSCGNLSHHAIRSLVLNPAVRAVAVVGCCYNLMTERLGPPARRRATLQALNGRPVAEAERHDVHGFPMSRRLAGHGGDGIRLNMTARMMACQAPQNWTRAESDAFFTRHYYRAVLQRILLDRGAVGRVRHGPRAAGEGEGDGPDGPEGPLDASTQLVVLGSLLRACYASLRAYVRGAAARARRAAARCTRRWRA